MRIVGGRLKGRHLEQPKTMSIRPTSDRVRESVFNILEHGIEGFQVRGARVLDLFAGTGALGIEALSRGATRCLFVDSSADARAIVRRNIEALALGGITRVLRSDATEMGMSTNRDTFVLVFLDPPYGRALGERTLAAIRDNGWLAPGAIIVAEESQASPMNWPTGFEELQRRRYGATEITIARWSEGAAG